MNNPDDQINFQKYSEKSKHAFDKKRLIEGNQFAIKNEFLAMKRRVVT